MAEHWSIEKFLRLPVWKNSQNVIGVLYRCACSISNTNIKPQIGTVIQRDEKGIHVRSVQLT